MDVGTGNGQAAVGLAAHFDGVLALDPSQAQLANATPHARVVYRQASAEATGAAAASADLIVVGQAFHWFQHDAFFAEVRRVARAGARLGVWCYPLMRITPAIDAVVDELYEERLGRYWEPERRLVETGYREVAFPFQELPVPPFEMRFAWGLAQLGGYLGTWSPLKRYIEANGKNPIEELWPRLAGAWGDAACEREVRWPLAVRLFNLS